MQKSYLVILERGEQYQVYAENEKEAYKRCIELHPDMAGADVRDIKEYKIEEYRI